MLMTSISTINLSQVIQSPIQGSGNTPDLVLLYEKWQCDLKFSPLTPQSDHTLISLRFFNATNHHREDGAVILLHPQQLTGPVVLLHVPFESLVTTWNKGVAKALDQIVSMQPVISRNPGAPHDLWRSLGR